MRGTLVALGITVFLGVAVTIAVLGTSEPVAGTPVAARQPQEQESAAPPLEPQCDGGPQLRISGSALARVAADHLTSTYDAACPETAVSYEPVGTGAGIQQFVAGETGMATTDRPLNETERRDAGRRCEIQQLPFVVQPIVVHFRLAVGEQLNLDAPTLTKIFSGAVTRWNDPAIVALNPDISIPGLPITVVGRSTESTVTAVFQQYLTAVGGWTGGTGPAFTGAATVSARTEAETLSIIEQTDGAIGYLLVATSGKSIGMRIGSWSPDLPAVLKAVDAVLPAEGLELDPQKLYRTTKGYPLVVVNYAVFCANDRTARDFLRSALITVPDPISYQFPEGKWGDRFSKALQ